MTGADPQSYSTGLHGTSPAGEQGPAHIVADVALAAAQIGMFEWRVPTGQLIWDERTLELFGLDPGEFGRTIDAFWARVHPDDRERVEHGVRRAIDACGEHHDEYRIVLPSGEHRWVETRGRALAGPSGTGPADVVIGAVVDTTQQRVQDARDARVLETMPTAFFSLDRDWRFTYVNGRAEGLLRAARSELIGTSVWDRFPLAVGSDFQRNYARAMDTGEPVSFDAYYPPPLDVWFEVRAWPTEAGLSVYFMDVTERHRAREQAERQAAVGRVLTEVAADLATWDDGEFTVRVARTVAPHLGDWGIVTPVTADRGGQVSVGQQAGWHSDPAAAPLVERVAAGLPRGPLSEHTTLAAALRRGGVLVLDGDVLGAPDATIGTPESNAAFRELAPEAALLVPVLAGRTPVATVTAFFERGPVPPAARAWAEELIRQSRDVLDRAMLLRRQRHTVEVLQRAMLTRPPTLPGLEIGVRYLPATSAARVGGDWYDAFLADDGDALLVIGDVVGHDVEAAATMGQIRSFTRGIAAATTLPPAALLEHVDAALETLGTPLLATAVVARCSPARPDSDDHLLTWSNAGHPPPLLLHADGRVETLEGPADLILGAVAHTTRTQAETPLPAGSTVVLYTDGLVESRDRPLRDGIAQLVESVRAAADADVESFCDQVVDAMVERTRLTDDVALLVLRPRPVVDGRARPGGG